MKFFNRNYQKEIVDNKKKLEMLLSEARKNTDETQKLNLLAKASFFATYNVCGCFNSEEIENSLLNISQRHTVELPQKYNDNSVLHVFTACWITGGHTQVARRWIENSPSNQKHSMVFISQPNPETDTPHLLKKAVIEKNGELIYLDNSKSFIEKALELRQLASKYEKIVLHVHMDDIVPILAFGTLNFKRPITYFNHGDHLFWLGVSISDLVVNFRTSSSRVNEKFRNIEKNYVLPLPIDEITQNSDSVTAVDSIKKELGFSKDDKVILTMAAGYKYKPFENYDFTNVISQILSKNKDTVFLAIGPSLDEKCWKKLSKKFPNRVKILGFISNDKVDKYLKIADLAIDSFPFSSFVALMDIAKYNIPCLSLKTPLNEIDCFEEARISCETQRELASKVNYLLISNESSTLYPVLEENHIGEGFQKHLNRLYINFPTQHQIYNVKQDKDREVSDLELFVYKNQLATAPKTKKSYKNIIKDFFKRLK